MRSMTKPASRRRFGASRFLWTTSLVGSLFGGAGQAMAQTYPGFGTVDSTAVSNIIGDVAPTISSTPTALSVTLDAKSTVINWQDFNVPAMTVADFNSARTDQITVLNRVIGNGGPPTLTQIDGLLTSSNSGLNNISLFLVNPSGVMFGADGSYSGGSLVLSTLDITPTDFNDLDTNYRIFGGSTGALTLLNGGGTIAVTNGSFVAVGETLSIDKSVTATGGDVALVTASDIDLSLQTSSPLAIKINAGTTLGTATIGANGQLTGNSVMFAGASTAMASLLNVDSGATLTATDANGRVIISAGKGSDVPATAAGQAVVSYDAALATSTDSASFAGTIVSPELVAKTSGGFSATSALDASGDIDVSAGTTASFADKVTAGGNLTISADTVLLGDGADDDTQTAGGDVAITSGVGGIQVASSWQLGAVPLSGAVTFDGDVTATQDFLVNTTGTASILGNVSAGRNYSVTGGSVTLGNSAAAVTQRANGSVSITSSAGGITGSAPSGTGITLNSDFNVSGAEALSVNATGGAIDLGAASTLVGTSLGDPRANVLLEAHGDATAVGAIYADQLFVGSTGDFTAGGGIDTLQSLVISTDGAVSLKGINVRNSDAIVLVKSTGAGKDVSIDGNITGPSVSGASGPSLVIVQAGTPATGGKATLTGGVASRGGLLVEGGSVELGGSGSILMSAVEGIAINAGSGGVKGNGFLTLQSDLGGTTSASGNTNRLQIDSAGDVNLGADSRLVGGTSPAASNDARQANVIINAPSSAVTVGRIEGFNLNINAAGGVANLAGAVSTLNDVSVLAGTINLGDGTGSDSILTGRNLTVSAGSGGTQIASNWNLSPVPGTITFDGAVTSASTFIAQADGAVMVGAVTANTGGITLRSNAASVTASGSLSAPGDINVLAATSANVQSDVSAGVSYLVNGQSVLLGNSGSASQTANTGVSIVAGSGGVNALGTFTLQSDADGSAVPGSATDRLQIDSGGSIDLGATSHLVGGATPAGLTDQRQALVILNAPTGSVRVGQVDGYGLQVNATAGSATLAGPVSVLGDLDVRGATVNLGDGIGADDFTIGGGIFVKSGVGGTNLAQSWSLGASPLTGPVTFQGDIFGDANFIVNTAGAITLDDVTLTGANHDINLVSSGSTISAGSLSASRSVAVDAQGTAAVAGNVSVTAAGGSYVVRGDSVILGATGQTVSQTATGDVVITARNSSSDTSVLGLGTVRLEANSDSTGTELLQVNSLNGGIALGGSSSLVASRAVGNGSTISVSAASGKAISIGAAAGDLVQLVGNGDILAAGAIASNQGFSVATAGAIDLQGVNVTDPSANITLVSSGAGVKTAGALVAPGDIVVSANNAALVLGSVAAGGNYGASGSSVQLSGVSQSANGVIQIQAGAGGVSSLGNLTLRSNADGSPVLGERLEINSGGNVDLATAALFGGTNRQSDVIINAASANSLTIKGVEANSLFVSAPSAAITVTDPIRTTNALSLVTSQAITLGIVETTDAVASVNLESASGDVTLNGNLLAGGNVRIVSGADIRSQDMTSANGSISLTAADSVFGLSATETLPAGAGGNRVDAVTAGGAVSIIANQSDVRARSLASANGDVGITVAGSLTGLATGDPGNAITGPTLTTSASGAGVTIQAGNIVRLNSVQSAGAVAINQGSTGGVAIENITATGSDVSVNAGTSGFFLGLVDTGTGAGAVSLTSGLVTSPLAAPQYVAGPATLIDSGFGRTAVAAGGSVSIGGASGLLHQLGAVTAGTGGINVTGQGFTATTLTAANPAAGTISITANNGGLYFDSGSAGAGISLVKTGGTAATTGLLGDEIRVSGTLTTAAGDVNATSATNARFGDVTASNGSVIISATTGVLSIGNVIAGNSIALASAGDMNVQDLTANEDLGLQAGGALVAQNLAAGDDIVAAVSGTTNIVSLNQPGNGATPANVDARRIVFGGASLSVANGEDAQLGRRNVVIDSGGNLTLGTANATDSMALRSGGTLMAGSAVAGEDFAARATGNVSLSSVQAGDDADVISTGGSVSLPQVVTTGTGDDSRQTDLSGAGVALANGELLVRSNILVDAGGSVTLGVADAKASLVVRAAGTGSITGTSLTAGEDIAFSSGGTTTLTNATAGDDIDVTAVGDAALTNARSTGLGADDRRADFGNASRIAFGAETLGRSNVAVVTDGNATLGTVDAVASIGVLAKGATSTITGTSLTAGEDIALKSTLGTSIITAALAGDDVAVLAGTTANLPTTMTTGLGADDREVTFTGGIGFANTDGYGRSNILVDAGGSVALGMADAKASLVVRAAGTGLITGTTLAAGEDIALSSGGTTTVATATAGDDLDVTATGDVSLADARTTGLGIDDRRADFGNASRIGLGVETLGRSNVAVVTDGNATLGTVNAVASMGVLAKGAGSSITGTSLTAGEDIALKSTLGTTIITIASAGDDLVLLAGTTANLPTTMTTGLGADDREVTFTGRIGFANTDGYGRSNILVDAGGSVTLGVADAKASLVVRAVGIGSITGTTLTAGEDIALSSGGATSITTSTAGDDVDVTASGDASLANTRANATGADDRRADFSNASRIGFGAETLGRSNVAVVTDANATLGTVNAVASIAVLAKGAGSAISGTSLTAGEDIVLKSTLGTTIVTSARAGDDIIVLAGTTASVPNAVATGLGADNREVTFAGVIGFANTDSYNRGNIIADAGTDLTLGTAVATGSGNAGSVVGRAGGTITANFVSATQDFALRGGGDVTVTKAFAGDDIELSSAGGSIRFDEGSAGGGINDDTRVDFGGAKIAIASNDDHLGHNLVADALSNVTLGTATTTVAAQNSLAARATNGSITGFTLAAGEDVATRSGGATSISAVQAGDDVDVTATGDVSLTDARSTGTGPDNRRVDFGNANRIAFGAETLGRSNVVVVTDGNATLGTVNAAASIGVLAKGASSMITGTSLTAGEDIALSSRGATTVTSAVAGDDVVAFAGTNANLANTVTTGLGADNREVTFTGGIGFANADGYGRSNILVDAGDSVTLGVADAKASLAVRAAGAGSITGTTLTAGEDIALSSGGVTSVATSTAGDDIDVTAVGDAMLTNALSSGLGVDDRRVDFANASRIGFGAETLGRSNVSVVTDGNATLGTVDAVASLAVLAKGASSMITGTSLTAGEDIALKSTLGTTIVTSAKAGDDVVVLAGTTANLANTMTTGLGADNREVTFTGGIGFANADGYARSNILVDAGGAVTLGVADAKASLAVRAAGAGSITGTTLTAGEDIALSSGGMTMVTSAAAGDDIDVTATGDAALTDARSTGTGLDDRRVSFANPSRIGLGAETLGRSNVAVVTDGNATLGTVDAVASLAVLAKGVSSTITGTSLTAGEDIALKSTLGTTIITSAKAGDDVVVLAGTSVNLANAMTTGLGGDNREVMFTGGIGFANADGYGRSNILVDAGGAVTLGVADAKASLAVRAAGAGSITGTTLTAGEDIALSSGGATMVSTAAAGDDIDVTALGDAALTDARSTGAGADNRRVDFSNASRIGFGAETLGRSNVAVVTDGNATLGTVDAVASLAVLAKGTTSSITGTTLTAGEDIALKSTLGTTIASAIARDDVAVTAGTLADIDIATAQGGGSDSRDVTFTSGIGFTATARAGGSDIAVSGQSADVTTANASRDLSISSSTGGLSLVDGVAGRFATLDKTGSASDLRISGNLTAGSTVTIGSTTDILLASGKTVTSTAGSIGVTATRSIFGLAGQSAAPAVPEIGSLTTTGDLTLVGAGDVRADTLTAGGALGVTIGGSLTGSGTGAPVASVAGGNLAAAAAGQSVTVTAGNASGNVAYLDTIIAGGDVNVAANGIGINSVTAGGTLSLTAGSGGLNLGTGMAGTAILNVGGTALALPPLFSADETLDARFGASNLTSGTGITVNVASGLAQIGTAMAGSNISLTGLAMSVDKAVSANGALAMSATGGALYLGEGAAGLGVSLTKSGGTDPNDELRVKRTLSGVQSVVINSDTNARLGSVSSSAGDVSVRSTSDTTGNAGGRADLSAIAAGKSVTVNAGSLALLGTVQAGQDVSLTATGTADVTGATATTGNVSASAGSVLAGTVTAGSAITLVAGSGQLTLGTGTAGTTATLTKSGAAGELELTSMLTSGGDATVNSSTSARLGSVTATAGAVNVTSTFATTGIAGASIGTSDSGFGRANLSAGSGKSVTVTSGALAQLGTVGAGQNVTVTAGNASRNGAVDVTTATATAGALKLAARAVSPADAINDGDVLLGTGSSGTSATLTNKENGGAAGNVLVASALTAGSFVNIDAAGSATGGTVDANGGDTIITAGPLVNLAVAEASGKVSATAGSVVLGRATAGSALELTAGSGQLTLGTGTAGTTATLTKRTAGAAAGDLQVTTSLVANGKVTIDSAANAGLRTIQSTADNIDVTSAQIALTGAMTVGADKTVTLTNRADATGNKTVLGDAASNAGDFTLTDAELDLVSAPNLVISSGIKNVALGAFSLKGPTGAKTLKLLSTNASNISLSGLITEEAATARDVQIGGTQSASPALIPATTAANELAATIFATTSADAGGRILLPNATVELRAAKIIFALGASGTPGGLIDQARNLSADAVANMFVSRPDSVLYNPIPGYTQTDAGRTILSATKLTIRYTDFALFQNTAPAGLTAGLVLQRPGAAPGPSGQARLVLFSTSEAPKNSIALFGTIDGVIGNAAALLTTEIDTANGTRISRSSSRLNGCGIGSPEQGCLTTQSPPPQLRLFDERQALVFRTADDSVLPFDPLVSTNNEALFIDFGGVSLPYDEADCVPGAAAASCPQPGDKK